VKNQAEKNRKQ